MVRTNSFKLKLLLVLLIIVFCLINPSTYAQQQSGQAFQVTTTAFKFDPNGQEIPLAHSDGTPILPEEVEDVFGGENGFSILVDNLLVTSPFYGGQTGFEAQKRVIFQDLSDEAGWPEIHVVPNTVAVDPRFGRFKFADGDDDPPEVVGSVHLHWGMPTSGKKHGNFYYSVNLESDSTFVVIDVSDPTNPHMASMAHAGWAKAVTIFDNLAYVSPRGRLIVFDITNPYDVTEECTISLPGPWHAATGYVNKRGNLLYIPIEHNRIFIVDITDFPDYEIVKEINFTPDSDSHGSVPIIHNNLVFISESSYWFQASAIWPPIPPEMQIFDISDWNDVKLLSTVQVSPENIYLSDVAFDGPYMYVATSGDGLKIFDISDPENSELIGQYEKIPEFGPKYSPKDAYWALDISGDRIYISGQYGVSGYSGDDTNQGFIMEVDVSNPAEPFLINEYVEEEMYTYFHDIEVNNNFAYVVDTQYGLHIVDLDDHSQFSILGGYRTAGEGTDVYVYGDYAYVGQNLGGGVYIIDISDKTNPHVVNYYHTGFNIYGIKSVKNDILYVSGPGYEGLRFHGSAHFLAPIHVVDVRNPNELVLVKKIEPWINGNAEIHDNLLFTGLWIFNIEDPFNPDPIIEYPCGVHIFADGPLHKRGKYVYRAPGRWHYKVLEGSEWVDYGYIFSVYDFEDPANPILVSKIDMPDEVGNFVSNMIVRGDYALFPIGWGNGLQIVDISNPQEPVHLGELSKEDVGKSLRTVDMDGKYLYTQNYWPWNKIFHISEIEPNPSGPLPIKIKQKVAELDLFYSWRARIDGDYAYNVALNGLNIIDIPRGSEAPLTPVTVNYYSYENYVLLATNSILLKKNVKIVSGDIIVNDTGDKVELDIEKGVTTPVGYKVKANRMKIKKGATIDGDVYYNELDNKGTINGLMETPIDLSIFSFLPEFKTGVAGTENIKVKKNQTLTLDEGNYGEVTVDKKGKLILTGGIYNIHSLDLKDDVEFIFSAASEVRVEESITSKKDVYIGPTIDSEIKASDIIFYVTGEDENKETVMLGHDNTINANIYIKIGALHIHDGTVAAGAFIAQNIILEKEITITRESYFRSQDPVLAKTQILGTLEETESEEVTPLPGSFLLEQNYPNPFNPNTEIGFQIPEDCHIVLEIFNTLGNKIATLANSQYHAGYHHLIWNSVDLNSNPVPSGVYLYTLKAGNFTQIKKMILVR